MKKLKRSNFLEGAFIATFCIIITKIIGIIYVIPFYKIIGEQGGTLYGYAYNIYNVFLIISSAGIPLAISKLTSEYNTLNMHAKKARMYHIATKAIMVFSILSFLICFIFAPQLSNLIIGELEGGNTLKDVTLVIRLISFALLVVPFLSIERGYLQGHRYIKEPSISQVIEQIVRIAIIIIGSYLCVHIFKLPIQYAVGISVLGACIGGLATLIYLKIVTRKNKKEIGFGIEYKTTKKEDKEIIQKIIFYSIPFIIISLANTLYASTDMILMIKTLPKLGFSAADTEFISSVFTTWGIKFNTIITSIPNGLIISLIPNMVKDYTEKNMEAVNSNFNKCLKIILLIIAPLAIFLSGMSSSLWNVFYGANTYGPMIIKYSLIVTILDCLYIVNNSLLQSLNKPKVIYISVILGILINLGLDIPLMNLFHALNLPAYYGAITATLIGTAFSNIVSIIYLKRKMKFNYTETIKSIPRFIVSLIILLVMLFIFNKILPIDNPNRLVAIINLVISGIFCGGIYLLINFKQIKVLLPEKILKKLKISN
ncbi:MAG: polysaccharide biosynthesis protein [Bacilli bacterium]|nr:polysaccharide biosynthesis protein [Bacilli bacterium]